MCAAKLRHGRCPPVEVRHPMIAADEAIVGRETAAAATAPAAAAAAPSSIAVPWEWQEAASPTAGRAPGRQQPAAAVRD